MILHNLINEKLHSATAKLILYAILEKAEFEKKNTIKIEQTYLAELCCTSTKTVNRDLKYLEEENYLTFQRSTYNNLTTTQITLTEKSVNLINGNTSTEKKVLNKALKQPKTEDNKQVCNNNSIEELKNEYSKLDRIQRDCLNVIRNCQDDSYLTLYIKDAKENNVPEQLIQYTLSIRQ